MATTSETFEPLLSIRLGREPAAPIESWRQQYSLAFASDPLDPFMTVYQGEGAHLLRVHGRADFEVRADGSDICCRPEANTPWATVEQLLIDQIVPRALQLLGRPSLHASAVCGPAGVVGLLGEAGSGKSTLSAALCQRGHMLICDDCLAVELRPDAVLVHPGYPSVRLWPDSAEALLGDDHQLATASPRTDKLRKPYPLGGGMPPLIGLVHLVPDDNASEPQLLRLRARAGFALLTTSLHRLAPRGAAILSAEFALLSALAERIGIYELRYRQDYQAIDQLVQTLLAGVPAVTGGTARRDEFR